ncbi:uncharacterized protein LOC105665424 [Ceratitis capitata]|uniref:uncharacterized protein LOC105665424 n=1 Tax=Ceratitis capitata TaxID=7213 RepID=UPI00061881E7|nr:uncharacterized protein LOC105665424 [Ceratitis capitata]
MYLKSLLALCSICFAAASACSVSEADSTGEVPSILIFDTINENFKRFVDSVSKSFHFQKFERTGRDIAKRLDEWGENIKKEAEALKDNENGKNLMESVDKSIEEEKQSPNLKAVIEKYNRGADPFLSKIEKIKESAEPKFQELSQKMLDAVTSTLQDIAEIFQQEVKRINCSLH